jgi:DNA polymerase (family 10)
MRLEQARQIANNIKKVLTPYCDRIEIAGSIRRRKPIVHDIDIVLIEKPESALIIPSILATIGTITQNGSKIKRVLYHEEDIFIDIYFATPASWSTLLLIRTGSKENNIRLATIAKRQGWQLKANGDGLFNNHGDRIAGDTEESIYQVLGIPYQEPHDRH